MSNETIANQLQMQPTFQVELPWDLDECKKRLRGAIGSDELSGHAESAGPVIDYKVEPSEQRFWSPHLSIHLHRLENEGSTEAFCRFSPRPEIWTMVMAIYMMAACCLFGSMIFGFVQWTMGNAPWSLIVIPISVAVIASLHIASLIGQGWSRDQMALLKSRWERTIEIAKSS